MIKMFVLCVSCAPLLLLAADPWKAKKASEWTEKDATRILTNSPWAKPTSAELSFGRGDGMPGGPEGAGGPGGPPPGGPGGPGMGGPPPGGMGGPGGMEPPRFIVRWESAAPIREAAAKMEDPQGAKLADLTKEYYIVSVTGSGMPSGMRDQRRDEGRTLPDFGRADERMKGATSLIVHGGEKLPVAHVESIDTAGGRTLLFLFQRSRPIAANDKDVVFETSMGPMSLKSRFALKDMVYEGRLAL